MQPKSSKNYLRATKAILPWEQIPKIKTKDLKKEEKVTNLFKENQTLIKSKHLGILDRIRNRIEQEIKNTEIPKPVDDIMNIVSNIDILRISYSKIQKNKGNLTPGSDKTITADTINEKELQILSRKLKNGSFQWKPVRRILIEKPGKSEKRPLGLPDFDDKIVQGAILLTLESIYEPEFEKLNCNYGFRQNKDTNGAIEKIKETQFYQYAIEGDIKGAYDTVNHNKLIQILKKRISDKKFLNLVEKGLKSGYMLNFKKVETIIGTPQGSICSPILFNIYMNEFDKFIQYKLLQEQQTKKNTTENYIKSEANKEYEKIRSRKRKTIERIMKMRRSENPLETILPESFVKFVSNSEYIKSIYKNDEIYKEYQRKYNKIMTEEIEDRNEARFKKSNIRRQIKTYILKTLTNEQKEFVTEKYRKTLEMKLKEEKNQQLTLNSLDPERRETKTSYVRYADDWILFVRGTKETTEKLKENIAKFLQEELNLTLSEEKTKITDLYKNKALFLGYEIFYQRNPLTKRVMKSTTETTQRFRKLQIHMDSKRLETRFIQKGYIDKNKKPREVGFLTVLQDHEIITKFNEFMMGIGNYYIRQLSYPSRLTRWMYTLYYSCLKTLATKHKTSIKSIIKKYGYKDISLKITKKQKTKATDLRIISKYEYNKETKYAILLNYKEIMFELKKIKNKYELEKLNQLPKDLVREIDILKLHKVNFRTAFKTTAFCSICGKQDKNLHNHHINPLKRRNDKKYRGYKGFDQVIAALGRKQIPVCKKCHENIHAGKYEGLGLNEIYDTRLITPENFLKFKEDPSTNTTTPPSKSKKPKKIVIDDKNRTYYNQEFAVYLNKET